MERHAAVRIFHTLVRERENAPDLDRLHSLFLDKLVHDLPPPIQRPNNQVDIITPYQADLELRLQQEQSSDPYRTWYEDIEEYTYTYDYPEHSGDRLLDVSAEAEQFSSTVSNDTYTAGIWDGDLISGLLWHSWDFESSPSTPPGHSLTKPIQHPRAPSWSWANLDGSVRFVRRHQYTHDVPPTSTTITLTRDLRMHTDGSTSDSRYQSTPIRAASISLHGPAVEFRNFRGFTRSFARWLRKNRPLLGPHDCTPDISTDPDFVFTCTKYVVPLAWKRCHPLCRHGAGCDKDPMVYGLVLHFVGNGGVYDSLSAVEAARRESPGVVGMEVEVFMRCGIVVCYGSSFEGFKGQPVVIL